MKRRVVLLALGLLFLCACRGSESGEGPVATLTPPTESIQPTAPPEPTQGPDSEPAPYVSPIDFESLSASNPDICGWLEIPDTTVNYPVFQRKEDDTFYLTHNGEGKYSAAGSLFTEGAYNAADFTDPVTIIYGHRTNSRSLMFGPLQQIYSDPEQFEAHREMILYLPDRELHYEVFAAVPFPEWHILYNYNFNTKAMYNAFFDYLTSIRAIGAVFAEDCAVEPADQVLILSTCLSGNGNKRFLVCGKLCDNAQ